MDPQIGEYVRIDACTCYDEHNGQRGELLRIDAVGYVVHLPTWYRVPCVTARVTLIAPTLPLDYQQAVKTKKGR